MNQFRCLQLQPFLTHRVERRVSDVKRSLQYGKPIVVCKSSKVDKPITDGVNTDQNLDTGNGISPEM